MEGEKRQSRRNTALETIGKALLYLKPPGFYHYDQLLKPLLHIFAVECAVYFWNEGRPADEFHDPVDFMGVRDVASGTLGL